MNGVERNNNVRPSAPLHSHLGFDGVGEPPRPGFADARGEDAVLRRLGVHALDVVRARLTAGPSVRTTPVFARLKRRRLIEGDTCFFTGYCGERRATDEFKR